MSGPNLKQSNGLGPGRYTGLGLQLVGSILLGVWLGGKLDKRFDVGGLFTILGAFLGFGGTMWSLIRSLKKDERGEQ